MKATDILMDEHRVIERVLSVLELATDRLEAGEQVEPGLFIDAADFIRNFADGCHHRKEEGVLFVAMNEAGMPADSGPIAVMLAEHVQARAYTRALLEGAEKMQAGDAAATDQVVQNARSYAALLRQHIAKEDQILFPMADNVLAAPARQEKLLAEFERVEAEEAGADVHDRYVALADELERQIGA
ncbi:MAG TPA: hemerythrin domain-containing protein [Gemmatimonadota bacterium]|nr:hemerythrin domain-containing protein [Gemmatimonadota bacterium]